ncbi:hypothetical protein BDQ17DRAFT_1269418 [Cyathus striatus]|nr:hypothetical protein BDQ17DRAFT_1269418 [Cyathus striatus]
MNTRIPPHPNGFNPHNIASTSSSPYPDFPSMSQNQSHFQGNMSIPHRLQQQPIHNQHIPHNQWQPPMPSHSPSHSHPQHHPQQNFNHPSWSHQMQQQPFPPAMSGFNMSYLPAQVLQDALSMSAPVEATDEMTLVNALLSSRRKGETYKDGLNSLHGKNGHSASLWKDYYLDHKDRLDAWIASIVQKENKSTPVSVSSPAFGRDPNVIAAGFKGFPKSSAKPATIKKPSPSSFKVEPSPAPSTGSAPPKGRKQSSSKQSTPSIQFPPSTGGRRSTINSLTAPAPVYGDRLPPPNAEIKIPDPPSRTPSPPTRIIPQGRGNKYTQEDRDFFIKFISWHLSKNTELTRLDLCNMLAEKAPHHTSQSWASHWSNNHDLPDKILAAARGDEYSDEEGSESSEEEEKIPQRRRPKYRESSTEGEEEEEEDIEGESSDDGEPITVYKESEMGSKGEPFTEADHYIAAKYISTFPDWEEASSKERWEPFCEKHPQRSYKSWTEYYRRNEKLIGKLVRKMRKQQNSPIPGSRRASTNTQHARPNQLPSKSKRKHESEGGPGEMPAKRGREDHRDS